MIQERCGTTPLDHPHAGVTPPPRGPPITHQETDHSNRAPSNRPPMHQGIKHVPTIPRNRLRSNHHAPRNRPHSKHPPPRTDHATKHYLDGNAWFGHKEPIGSFRIVKVGEEGKRNEARSPKFSPSSRMVMVYFGTKIC